MIVMHELKPVSETRDWDWDWIGFWPIEAKLTKLEIGFLSFDWLNFNPITISIFSPIRALTCASSIRIRQNWCNFTTYICDVLRIYVLTCWSISLCKIIILQQSTKVFEEIRIWSIAATLQVSLDDIIATTIVIDSNVVRMSSNASFASFSIFVDSQADRQAFVSDFFASFFRRETS